MLSEKLKQPNRDYCDDQALRLQAIPRFSREMRIVKEYADALFECSRSNEVVKNVIDDILEYSVDIPSVADVRRMAHSLNAPEEGKKCEMCHGDRWVDAGVVNGYSGVKPCPLCRG